jgi:TolB protein
VTHKGKKNFAPSVSADGKSLVFVHQVKNQFNIAIMNLLTKKIRRVSSGILDESPSFSPDGKYILYSSKIANKGFLNIISRDGNKVIRASTLDGDLIEPFWGTNTQ